MAKDLAETEPKLGIRASLRLRVVRSIRDTGQEAAFLDYVADVSADAKRSIPASIRDDPVWQSNRELEVEAKALFLAGDLDGARQQLRKCEFIPHYDFCQTADYFLQFQFLYWELEAHDLSAALRRFRANDWRGLQPAVALRLARIYIVAGRQWEIADLLGEVNDRFRLAAEQGSLETGAAIRNQVSVGGAEEALQTALSQQKVFERVIGLTIVAEALANLPGAPDQTLD
jgi:hypothetical protein